MSKGYFSKIVVGAKYERLTCTGRAGLQFDSKYHYHFTCDCGTKFTCPASNVTSGNTKSCGCLRKELSAERGRMSPGPKFGTKQNRKPKVKPSGG